MKVYKSKEEQKKILQSYDKLLLLWGCDKSEYDIETIYGSTHVIECGDKNLPTLVLFHGVGDDSALMWIYNAAFLSKHFHIFAIDTIGGPGKSIPKRRSYRPHRCRVEIQREVKRANSDARFYRPSN